MAFRAPRKAPQFADLKSILAQTRETEDPLYQVVQEIIERLATFQFDVTPTTPTGGGSGGGSGGDATKFGTYLTKEDDTAVLPNSAQLLARYGIKFDDSLVGRRTVDLDLEYLGSYVSGPQYSDGDIAVGSDGIAYLCVKPTNSPPVPWPGIGVSTAPAPVDATYWTVTPHASLTNERALNGLTNGYVKSTAGEPSTVQVIPISEGGTSATNAPNARTNLGIGTMGVQNADNVAITGGTIVASNISSTGGMDAQAFTAFNYMVIQSTDASLYFINNSTNTRWRFVSGGGGILYFNVYNADGSGGAVVAQMNPNGNINFSNGVAAGYYVGDGSNLTSLNASQLATGIANPARLGTGAANSSTFLRGDGVWATPGGIPSGLIVLNDGPCPPGWTRVGWDGYFLRVNSSAGSVGGAASHSHGSGSLGVNSHNHGGSASFSGTTDSVGDHAHGVNGNVNGTTSGDSGPGFNIDAGNSGTVANHGHSHTFAANFSVASNNAGGHNHSFSGSGGIPVEAPGIHGSTDAQLNLPLYIDVILCKKD